MSDFQRMSALEATKTRLRQLNAQREALEIEAEAIAEELNSPGINGEPPAGVKTSLVDSEGYPRADIDIFNVKTKRNRLAIINTDHKALMKQIETELAQLHSLSGNVGSLSITTTASTSTNSSSALSATLTQTSSSSISTTHSNRSFAHIDEILEGSPAKMAGIQDGDELIAFGTIRFETLDNLNCIPAFIGQHVNRAVPLEIRRQSGVPGEEGREQMLKLTLIPKPWGGRGMLGCHLTHLQR